MPKFAKENRVTLPGGNGAQAVVVDCTEQLPGFPVYTLHWLDEVGDTHTATVGEGDLVDAQPTTLMLCANIPALKVMIEKAPKPKEIIFKDKVKPKRKR